MTDPNGSQEPSAEESSEEPEDQLEEGSLISHLIELRSRLVKASISVLAVFICLVPFAQEIFSMVADPLIDQLPEGSSMIATQVASPFLTPFKTTLFVALFFAMPVVIYQIWAFVAPGLYRKEKELCDPARRFEYCPVLPGHRVRLFRRVSADVCVFQFRHTRRRADDDGHQQLPGLHPDDLLCVRHCVRGADCYCHARRDRHDEHLTASRKNVPFVFLGAFVVGMFLTPPDVISQTLLAVPIYVFYSRPES